MKTGWIIGLSVGGFATAAGLVYLATKPKSLDAGKDIKSNIGTSNSNSNTINTQNQTSQDNKAQGSTSTNTTEQAKEILKPTCDLESMAGLECEARNNKLYYEYLNKVGAYCRNFEEALPYLVAGLPDPLPENAIHLGGASLYELIASGMSDSSSKVKALMGKTGSWAYDVAVKDNDYWRVFRASPTVWQPIRDAAAGSYTKQKMNKPVFKTIMYYLDYLANTGKATTNNVQEMRRRLIEMDKNA